MLEGKQYTIAKQPMLSKKMMNKGAINICSAIAAALSVAPLMTTMLAQLAEQLASLTTPLVTILGRHQLHGDKGDKMDGMRPSTIS